MTTNHSPHVANVLRHWAVAGVAALMAVAWVAISLVVPSSAEPSPAGAARATGGVAQTLNLKLYDPQAVYVNNYGGHTKDEAAEANTVRTQVDKRHPNINSGFTPLDHMKLNRQFLDSIKTDHGPVGWWDTLKKFFDGLFDPRNGGSVTYEDNTVAVCFNPTMAGNNSAGTAWIFAKPEVAPTHAGVPAPFPLDKMIDRSFHPTALQQEQGKALSALYDTYGFTKYEMAIYQRVAWRIVSEYRLRNDNDNTEAQQKQKEDELYAEVVRKAKQLDTNANLLKSLKVQITPQGDGRYTVRITGSEEAKKALAAASNENGALKINGQPVPVKQALQQQGYQVNVECKDGSTHVEAEFEGKIKLSGLYAFTYKPDKSPWYGQDQVHLVLGSREVTVKGSASVTTSCTPPTHTTTTTTSTHSVPPSSTTTTTTPTATKTTTTPVHPVTSTTTTTPTPTTTKPTPTATTTTPVHPVPSTSTTTPTPTATTTTPVHPVPSTSTTTPTPTTTKPTPTKTTPTPAPVPPSIGTTASNAADGSKGVTEGVQATVKDVVAVSNFQPGKYTLVGKLVDDQGHTVEGVTAHPVTFKVVKGEKSKRVEMLFTVPAGAVKGSKLVAFEKAFHGDVTTTVGTYDKPNLPQGDNTPVAKHENRNDHDQTVSVHKPPTTGFSVAKQAVKPVAGLDLPGKFGFEYYCGDHDPAASDWQSLGQVTAGGDAKHVSGVKVGVTCYVRESDAAVAHAKLSTSWTVDNVAVSDEASLVKDSAGNPVGVKFTARKGVEAAVAATNVYRPLGGHLTVAKKLVDTTGDKVAPASVKLHYVCATGASKDGLVAQGVQTVKANAPAVQIGETLPVGSRCVVSEEAGAAPAGTSFVTGWDVDGASAKPADVTWGGVKLSDAVKTGPVGPGATVSVVATNTYRDNRAGFTLVKRVNSSDERAKAASFKFDYSCTTGEADPVKGEFTLHDGETFASSSVKALDGLRKGSVCRITEETPASITKLDYQGVTYDEVAHSDASFHTTGADKRTLEVTLGLDKAPAAFRATNTFQPPVNVPTPKIGTVLAGPQGVKTVDLGKVGESVDLVDTVHYEGLVAGSRYYLQGRLVDAAGKPVGVSAVSEFTPAGKSGDVVSGDTQMTFKVPRKVLEANASVVAFEKVWAESAVKDVKPGTPGSLSPKSPTDKPVASHENPNSPSQTVTVKVPPQPGPKARIVLTKRVDAQGLEIPAGREYAFHVACGEQGQDGFVSRDVKLAAGKQVGVDVAAGLKCTVSEAADSVAGVAGQVSFTVDGVNGSDVAVKRGVEFTVPANATGRVGVTATNAYVRPVAPKIGTTATNKTDQSKSLGYGQDATIQDVVAWSGLPAGDYVLAARLVKNVSGQAVAVPQASAGLVPFTVKPGVKSGRQVVLVSVPGKLVVPDSKFVVFERVYRAVDVDQSAGVKHDAVPVATHEDVNDQGQTVVVERRKPTHPKLVIAKTVQGVNPAAGQEFSFKVSCENADEKALVVDVKAPAGGVSKPVDVRAGDVCTVSEDMAAAHVNGALPQAVQWAASSEVSLAAGADAYTRVFKVPAVDATLQLQATNVYTPPVSTPPATPPCTTPATPGTPGTATTPGKPGTSTTPGKPGTPTTPECPPVTTPPCTTPATPGTPGTATTPGKPGTSTTPGKPGTPGTPTTPECPPVTTPPCTTPATPGTPGTATTPGKPGTSTTPGKPGTPTTPECPPASTPHKTTPSKTSSTPATPVTVTKTVTTPATPETVKTTVTTTPPASTVTVTPPTSTVTVTKTVTTTPPATGNTPNTPNTPNTQNTPPCTTPGQPGSGTPGKPGQQVPPQCPPVQTGPAPKLQTVATGLDAHSHQIAVGQYSVVADTVYWSDLPAGDYTLVGTLMDKATQAPVPGATPVTPVPLHVEAGMKSGSKVMLFSVPAASAKAGAKFVAFERLYKADDVDLLGRAKVRNGLAARPVAEHTNIADKAQTVTVKPGAPTPHHPLTSRPPIVPAAPTPAGPVTPLASLPPLAKTGVATGTLAVLAGAVLVVGAGLARLRRRQLER